VTGDDISSPAVRLGLRENLGQFSLLVLVNAFAGYLASVYGLRPEPFYLGVAYAVFGLLVSVFQVRDTGEHVRLEMRSHPPERDRVTLREVFTTTSLKDRNLFACSQAGLVNNLNDGMSWGVFPLYFSTFGLGVGRIGILKAVYPAV
jgi:hypothetical protein